MKRSLEEGWFPAVQGELGSVTLWIPGSLLLLGWVVLRTPAVTAALLGAGVGALAGAGLGRLEARYIIKGLQARGEVTRRWNDPNPAGALATVVPLLIAIVAGFATQSGMSG